MVLIAWLWIECKVKIQKSFAICVNAALGSMWPVGGKAAIDDELVMGCVS